MNDAALAILNGAINSLQALSNQQQAVIDGDTTDAAAAQAKLDADRADIAAQAAAKDSTDGITSVLQGLVARNTPAPVSPTPPVVPPTVPPTP